MPRLRPFKSLGIALSMLAFLAAISRADDPVRIRSFEDLVKFVKHHQVTSVDQLLTFLDPELLRNYSFVVKSRSQMGASFNRPRVNLFNDDATFIMAYAGDPTVRDGNVIEVIQSGPFPTRFGKIEFFADGTRAILRPEHAQECYACHSSANFKTPAARLEAHPIWDTYPDWIDRYGSAHKPHSENRFSGTSAAPESALMNANYAEFLKDAQTNPRYQHLTDLQIRSQLHLGDLNSKLGEKILKNDMIKAAALMKASPHFKRYENALMQLHRPTEFTRQLSPEDRHAYETEAPNIRARMKRGQEKYEVDKLRRFKAIQFPDSPYEPGLVTARVSQLRHNPVGLVEFDSALLGLENASYVKLLFALEKMDLPTEVLNLTLEKASYSITQGSLFFDSFPQILAKTPSTCDEALSPLTP